jgi:hypothetical protein
VNPSDEPSPLVRGSALLAVDLGLRTGLALYRDDGRLRWYRSRNFGSSARLRRAIPGLLRQAGEDLRLVVLEGSRQLAEIWRRPARRRDIKLWLIGAEQWRSRLLLSREQRTAAAAKAHANGLARRVIAWSGAPRPTSLRHDAAEAILIGLWGVLELGWLERLPAELRRPLRGRGAG